MVVPYPILFTADWHLKLGQKNVPVEWARKRYQTFFNEIHKLEKEVKLHIIGGDLFDRLPTMDELELYFEFSFDSSFYLTLSIYYLSLRLSYSILS